MYLYNYVYIIYIYIYIYYIHIHRYACSEGIDLTWSMSQSMKASYAQLSAEPQQYLSDLSGEAVLKLADGRDATMLYRSTHALASRFLELATSIPDPFCPSIY